MLEEFLENLPLIPSRPVLEIPADLSDEASVDRLVDELKKRPHLREITLLNGRMGRSDLARFAELEQIKVLKWVNTGERKRTPTGIFKMSNLQSLEIRHSDFRLIPDEIGQMLELRQFRFQGNQTRRLILEVSEQISELQKLETLEISNVFIDRLPESITQLKSLKKLGLYNCERLYELPKSLGDLKQLKVLELVNNAIRELPNSIGELQELEALDLTKNAFTHLPDSFCELSKLEKLSLDACRRLEQLPKDFSQLANLKSLKINNEVLDYEAALQQIIDLPSLEVLEVLRFDDQEFVVPDNIQEMTALKWLKLKVGKMDTVDFVKKISPLPKLEYLDLQGYDLEVLPLEFKRLQQLQSIRFSLSDMEEMAVSRFFALLAELPQLKRINISRSAKYLPREIAFLPHLETLDLSYCPLHSLPQDLFKLNDLKFLNIRGCGIPHHEVEQLRAVLPKCNILAS